MKTPYYSGSFTAAQHTDVDDDDQLRERMLEHRLANRDDVREISIVTALPRYRESGTEFAKRIHDKKDMSWAMHWALQVGDQFFELQRGYPDPLRTGLRMSKWDDHQRSQIIKRHRQGTTAMTDDEIRAVGERYFSRLERIDINIYDLWCNNCQVAVDYMLRDIGGLSYYRMKLQSVQDMVKQFFYNALVSVTQMFGRYRGWNEEIIAKYTEILHKTLRVMTSRAEYPKTHWIREDIDAADGALKKVTSVTDHWLLTVLESSLSLKKGSEDLYVCRGVDGKAELNFEALKKATKGMFEEGQDWRLSWIQAMPWLTAGLLVGTPKWAYAVISIALSQANQLYKERTKLKGSEAGLGESLAGLGMSPRVQSGISTTSNTPKPSDKRRFTNGQRRVRSKTFPIDSKFIPRYERHLSTAGVPYFYDHVKKSRTWDAPEQQELGSKITNPPLKKWEETQEDGRTIYVNRITGERIDTRPGPAEVWVVKQRVKADWVKSTSMALPHGWEMRRTDEGEMYYLNHSIDPPVTTTYHPMRQEIDDERRSILPEWNVEWDYERGKKYRKLETGEIRWKAIDGPQHESMSEKSKAASKKPQKVFDEPLPHGWKMTVRDDRQKIYMNGKVGKERIERTTHPLSDKRKRLQPEWEMRYTPGDRRYWVHYGNGGSGSTWWTRNKVVKNTSLKNNASGWKLAKNGHDWEWFEGGDIPHSEIPVLDIDDPAEFEFREYPFLLPPGLKDEDGAFIEPLPSNWVRRAEEDGRVYFWNFQDEVRSDQHPHEEERRNLPALWEMRFTRHGRQYFIDHGDGSTWWTHPREAKHKQKIRAQPGQSQNGWKIAEDGITWERFEEQSTAKATKASTEDLVHTQSNESESPQRERAIDPWRSMSNPRDWLKQVSSSDVVANVRTAGMEAVANARTRIPRTPKLFRKSTTSPSINSVSSMTSDLVESSIINVDGKDEMDEQWLVGSPGMITEKPQSVEIPEQVDTSPIITEEPRLTAGLGSDSSPQNREVQEGAAPTIPVNSPQEFLKEDVAIEGTELIDTEPISGESPSIEDPKVESTPWKGTQRDWAKRTRSSLLALRKKHSKSGSKGGPTLPDEKVVLERKDDAVVDGLGISSVEYYDGGAVLLEPIEENVDRPQLPPRGGKVDEDVSGMGNNVRNCSTDGK